jgi:hypothetical protein
MPDGRQAGSRQWETSWPAIIMIIFIVQKYYKYIGWAGPRGPGSPVILYKLGTSTQWRLYCSCKSYCPVLWRLYSIARASRIVQPCPSVSCAAYNGGYIARASRTVQSRGG